MKKDLGMEIMAFDVCTGSLKQLGMVKDKIGLQVLESHIIFHQNKK